MAPVQDAIVRLPARLREVVTLFYVHECSQQDVATFLGLPVTTVNTRLHAARGQLKRRMLRRFFGQPFFAAERYTHRPGVIVPLAESLRVCREILDGVHDAVPTEAFFFTGGIDEIRSQGKSPAVTSP